MLIMESIEQLSQCIQTYQDTRNRKQKSSIFVAEFIEDFYNQREGVNLPIGFDSKMALKVALNMYLTRESK